MKKKSVLTKRIVFYSFMILFPIAIIVLLELMLRLFNFGLDYSIIAKIEREGKEYYTLNQLVGRRYFNEDRLYYRKGSHDFFEVIKNPNTIRVFCFGASTTAGFPFEYNAIPTEFFRTFLVNTLPDKNIEVLNTAIAATNSYTVTEFVNELANYKPDLYIVYMGQNEFYGAFGVGSTISTGKSRLLIKSYLYFQQFKTFQLLKNVFTTIANYFYPHSSSKQKLLMEEMVANNSIEYDSEDYTTAVNTFTYNYKAIIKTAKENNIPIIISTLVTNENGQPPFVTIYNENLSGSLKNNFDQNYDLGINYLKKKAYTEALSCFQKILKIDSTTANVHYQIGICYENLGNYHEAKKQYITAQNFDGLKFRAPSEFNEIIKRVSIENNIYLADVNKYFTENSPNGIVGENLLVDHVHPNINGYFLLAKSWYITILENKLLGLSRQSIIEDSIIRRQLAITKLDSLIGTLKIAKLKSKPPFTNKNTEFNFTPKNIIEKIAFNYIKGNHTSWADAHISAADEYLKTNDYKNALNEYRAILQTDDTKPQLLAVIGDMYFKLNRFSKAERNYIKSYKISKNPYLKYSLGLTFLKLNKIENGIVLLESCLMENKINPNLFNHEELQDIKLNLKFAYSILSIIK